MPIEAVMIFRWKLERIFGDMFAFLLILEAGGNVGVERGPLPYSAVINTILRNILVAYLWKAFGCFCGNFGGERSSRGFFGQVTA